MDESGNDQSVLSLDERGLSESVQSEVVDRYSKILTFCRGLMEDIEADEDSPGFSRTHKTVPSLYNMLNTLATDGKQIDQVIEGVEADSDNESFRAGKRAVADLCAIKEEMAKMMEELSKKHADLLKKGGSLLGLKRLAEGCSEGFGLEVAKWYGEEAGKAAKIGVKAVSPERDGEGWRVVVIGKDGGLIVLVDDQLRFSGAYPIFGCRVMSFDHYMDVARPALMSIGHWAPPQLGGVILSTRRAGFSPTKDVMDEFLGYVPGKGPTVYRVKAVGGKETQMKSCIVEAVTTGKTASSGSDLKERLARRRSEIQGAAMVVVRKPGKYQGIGGKVDVSNVVERNDHLEFPVELEFNTGLRTKVWVTDEDVDVALSR